MILVRQLLGNGRVMTLRRSIILVTAVALCAGGSAAPTADAKARTVTKLRPYSIPAANLAKLKQHFIRQVRSRYDVGEWAPMRFERTPTSS
jgi:hypothetical protein